MEPSGARGRSGRDGRTRADRSRAGPLPPAAVPRWHVRVRGNPEAERSGLPQRACSHLHRCPLEGFADGTPGGPLLEPALSHAAAAGVGVALLEILIGVLVVMGVLTRPAAAIGLALNLVLFLTASWHTVPTSSARTSCSSSRGFRSCSPAPQGQPTAAALIARRPPGLRRAKGPGRILTRRALLAQARARRRGHGGRGGSINPGPRHLSGAAPATRDSNSKTR